MLGNDEHHHWFGLSRVLIDRAAKGDRSLIEVRAYRDRRQAETDAIAGSAPRRATATASLVEVTAWFPFRACLRSLKPAFRRPIRLPAGRLAA